MYLLGNIKNLFDNRMWKTKLFRLSTPVAYLLSSERDLLLKIVLLKRGLIGGFFVRFVGLVSFWNKSYI